MAEKIELEAAGVPSRREGVDWTIAGPLALAHFVALLMPVTYSPAALALFAGLYAVTGTGVTLGAHRLFTHASFVAHPVLRRALALMFLASAQGSLLRWVRDHHIHHRHSDHEGDPHSPHVHGGFWHAQLTWLWERPPSRAENKLLYQRYAARLGDEAFHKAMARPGVMLAFHVGMMVACYLVGACAAEGLRPEALWLGWEMGVGCVVWGVYGRIIAVLHATSLVNSAAHLWGYRAYTTPEGSRNNWWVALVSLGEGWHNNHHGRPAAANQGFHRWWEWDPTFVVLLALGACGLAHDVRVYRARTGKTEVWFRRKRDAAADASVLDARTKQGKRARPKVTFCAPAELAAMEDRMWALVKAMIRCEEAEWRASFRATERYAIYAVAGEMVGFSSVMEAELNVAGRKVWTIGLGQTVVLPAYRNQFLVQRALIFRWMRRFVRRPLQPIYIWGSCVSYKSYLSFVKVLRVVYPRQGVTTPPRHAAVLDALGARWYPEEYDRQLQVVVQRNLAVIDAQSQPTMADLADADIAFYRDRVPALVHDSAGLLTISPCIRSNFLPMVWGWVRNAVRKWLGGKRRRPRG